MSHGTAPQPPHTPQLSHAAFLRDPFRQGRGVASSGLAPKASPSDF